MGASCVAASGNGTNKTISSGATLTIAVTDEVMSEMVKCLPWFDALCLIGTGVSIS